MFRDLPVVAPDSPDDEIARHYEDILLELDAALLELERRAAELPDDEIDAHVEALVA